MNRVAASRLFDLSRVLDVPISFFFNDMPEMVPDPSQSQPLSAWAEPQGISGDDVMNRRETLALAHAYYRITDPAVRKRVFDLIKTLAPENERAQRRSR